MPPKTGVKIKLGGRTRTLRYTTPALNRMEDERGEPLTRTLVAAGQYSTRAITALVWAGLLHEEPALEIADVEQIIDPPVNPVLSAVMKALEPWVKDKGGDAEGNPEAAA